MLLPPTPETAAAFFGTFKCGAILLSMSVLYGDEGIRHRVSDSGAKVLLTDAANVGPDRPVARRARAADRGPAGRRRRHVHARGHARRRPGAALLLLRHDRAGEGDPARAPLPARARGVRLLPRRAGRRAVPRHGRVGVGGGHRAAARPVAARRGAARLPARGRLRPAPAARRALAPRRDERVHDADRDALDDGRSPTPAPATRSSSASSAAPASRSTPRRSAGSASSTASPCSTTTGSPSPIRSSPTTRSCAVREGSMGKPMPGWDVQILDEDERPVPDGRARRDLPARALEPALSARLLEQRGGVGARRSAASGSTPRTPPRPTRTATSGTRAAPTT